MHATTTENNMSKQYFVGTCQICFRTQRVHDNKMVLHGYERPGDGMAHGQCRGAYLPAFQLENKDTKQYLSDLKQEAQTIKSQIEQLGDIPELAYEWSKTHTEQEKAVFAHFRQLERQLDSVNREIAKVEYRLSRWQLATLIPADQLPRQAKTSHLCKLCGFELHGTYTDTSLLDGIEFDCKRCERYNLIMELDMETIRKEYISRRHVANHSKARRLKTYKQFRDEINDRIDQWNGDVV
jgi:DNA repair exonuclease SbcCD ATPase subunit